MRLPETTTLRPDPRARPWRGLWLLLLPTGVVAVDLNVLFLALPELTADLEVGAAAQLWISDGYGVVVGVLAIVAGAVGDRFGRRRLLVLGSAGFLVASVLAAFAPTWEVLLVARVLQAVAGATLMPSTLALVSELFRDEAERGRAVAAWATTQFAFASFGPVLGGVLLHWWWWGSVFLLAVPVGVAVLVLAPRLLPEQVAPDDGERVDGLDAGLLVATLACLFVVIKSAIPGQDVSAGVPVAAAVGAVLLGRSFVRRQLTCTSPLLDLRVLAAPSVAVTVSALVLAAVALAGTGFWVTQYLQSDAGLSPLAAAVAFAPMGLGIAAGTQLAARLARVVASDVLVPMGLTVSAGAAALLVLTGADHPLLVPVLACTVLGLGCGPLFASGTHRIVSAAPPGAAGRAAALAETGNHVGAATGIAVLGTLGRVASDGVRTGSGELAGSLQVAGAAAAVVLAACALLTARDLRAGRTRKDPDDVCGGSAGRDPSMPERA